MAQHLVADAREQAGFRRGPGRGRDAARPDKSRR
jgi:hypothetical protein